MVLGLGTRVDALDLALDHGTSSGLLASVMLELEMELDLLVEWVIDQYFFFFAPFASNLLSKTSGLPYT